MAYDFDVDYVFPWVNPLDPVWQEKFLSYKEQDSSEDIENDKAMLGQRFRDNGFLKYVFRCIEKNAPWIRKVHIIVDSESQVPSWLDTAKVDVIYHRDYIPEEYLPVFNSCTIETFMPILGNRIAEHFLYANDDVFLMGPVEKSDFFDEEGRPKLFLRKKPKFPRDKGLTGFQKHCKRIYDSVMGQNANRVQYLKPRHDVSPFLMSGLRGTYLEFGSKIRQSTTRFRELDTNFNQYMFHYWLFRERKCGTATYPFYYGQLRKSRIMVDNGDGTYRVCDGLRDCKTACLNDTRATEQEALDFALGYFESKFPEKSSFEL